MSEFTDQCAVMQWARMNAVRHPELRWLNASLNGVPLYPRVASRMKAAGMTAGVSDLFLPVARGSYGGLFVELKVGRNKPSEDQLEFIEFVQKQNYRAVVVYGVKQAVNVIAEYLEIDLPFEGDAMIYPIGTKGA